jgi:DUF4097 and DUF4098 domain-containing protein YvlB
METFAFSNAMSKSMNHKFIYRFIPATIAILVFAAPLLRSQTPDRVAVPLTDPTRPATVRAHLLNGSITVRGSDVKEITVEARLRDGGRIEGRNEGRAEGGMRRIPTNSTGLSVDADNNQVRITTDQINHTVDLMIIVPVRTSLVLKSVNDGSIIVTGVDGELDVDNVNGPVTLKSVSGSVVAHALNDKVLVTMNRVDPQKPMAFSSLNGDIDVTFPPDLKANVSMRTDNGEVFSDFDVQLQANSPHQTVEDNRSQGGKYRVRVDKTVRGTINGGGPEIQFKNFNGNIYIRKSVAKQ